MGAFNADVKFASRNVYHCVTDWRMLDVTDSDHTLLVLRFTGISLKDKATEKLWFKPGKANWEKFHVANVTAGKSIVPTGSSGSSNKCTNKGCKNSARNKRDSARNGVAVALLLGLGKSEILMAKLHVMYFRGGLNPDLLVNIMV